MSHQQATSSLWPALQPRLARFLPADLFNRLRALPENLAQPDYDRQSHIAAELQAAIQTLEPLYRVLINYAPRYLLELDPSPGDPRGEMLAGTFIFADVTGFTALTERLARQAQGRGPEIMNRIMNSLFASLLDPLAASGGDLLFFVGDAVLAYFPQQEQAQDVWQAVRAALRMQRAILPFAELETEVGRSSLTMSVGIERGPAYAGVVGTKRRMELLISGPATYGAALAEKEADPGQVWLGPQARAIAQGHFTLAGAAVIDDLGAALGDYEISLPTRKQGRFVLLSLEIPELLAALETSLQRVERLAPFLPEDMLAHLVNTDRHRRLRAEFRPVTTQFVYISGLEELAMSRGPELATAVFQRYFVRAQEIVNRHEGVVSQVDAFGQNFILLNTFGVPRMHEGTKLYAISAALQLARALEQVNREFELDPPLQQRCGITHGLTFNGEIGAKYRRESVIAGPAVNRAARLMDKARPGQIILDADIWAEARAAFAGEPLPAVTLKGIAGPVVIINVREVRLGTRLQPLERPLLGREAEQSCLDQAAAMLLTSPVGGGSAWLVGGETGLGKTALMSYLAQIARERALTLCVGRCQPYSKHIPLFPWLDLLSGWLELDEHAADRRQQLARLNTELASLGLLASKNVLMDLLALPLVKAAGGATKTPPSGSGGSLLSLLNSKLSPAESSPPAAQPEAIRSNSLIQRPLPRPADSPKTMWQRLAEQVSGSQVLHNLLKKLAERQPLLVILEDIHWADDESLALLRSLAAETPALPLMLVATTANSPTTEADRLTPMPLSPLSEAALVQIAQRKLGARELDESMARWICYQAGGNPLYAEELCQALLQSDAVLLDRQTGEARWTRYLPALPLSLHQLLLARFDKLPPAEQQVLRRGAAIGLSFEEEAVLKLCHNRLGAAEAQAALNEAVQASFLTVIQDKVYRFIHPLMQEAIYATLSFAQREIWHTQIGDWLVEHRSNQEQVLDLIAYHYLRGKDAGKAARFGRQAGDRACQHGAYTGALEYYQQVLARPDAPAEERRKALEGEANVRALQQAGGQL